ncbi:MAG: DUF3899 domain-containing protein [Firmicutes bacterium]|nr:DUF3899 domain-containing protein [Bacillota bacterium]
MQSSSLKTTLYTALTGLAVGLAGALAVHRQESLLQFASNLLFFGGIALLVYGLFSFALHLGFFSGAIYSFKKVVESLTVKSYDPRLSETKSRPEFERSHKRGGIRSTELLLAALFLLLSFLLALI